MTKIDERAYIVVSKNEIGVTNDVNDLAGLLNELKPGEIVKIEAGYKEALLDKEATVLRLDMVINAHGENKVLFPPRHNDYNLVLRNRDEHKLRKFYSYIEPEQSIGTNEQPRLLGSLIEGGDKHVK